ncbi:MAG: PilZ domain-containing protein [Terriglobales bacterium]|jgi:hypothetical protein
MKSENQYKERELRVLVEAGATVDVTKNGQRIHATTVNMSGSGVLLSFDGPVELEVGDQVMGEFKVENKGVNALVYWGLGNVVRVEGCRVAIMFKGGVFSPLHPEAGVAAGI